MNGSRSSSSNAAFHAVRLVQSDAEAKVKTSRQASVSLTGVIIGSANVEQQEGQAQGTPEQNGDGGSKSRHAFLLSQAPRTKIAGLPILRTKIKPSEALSLEMDTEVANGSRFPQQFKGASKRKNTETANHATKLPKKPLSHFSIPQSATDFFNSNKRRLKSHVHTTTETTNGGFPNQTSDKNLETVIVSKGIEMKRVESKVSYTKPIVTASGTRKDVIKKNTTETDPNNKGVHGNGAFNERTNAAAPKVKQKSSIKITESTALKKSSKSKHKPVKDVNIMKVPQPTSTNGQQICNNEVNSPSKEIKGEPTLTSTIQPSSTTVIPGSSSTQNGLNHAVGVVSEPQNSQPVESYKTLKEFLSMPSVPLPEKKAEPEKAKVLYKSRFWDYVDPKKKESPNRPSNNDKQKSYDASVVKSYMEKQKEIRRLKELKEYQERQKELENKKKQLLELNEKCKNLVHKGSHQSTKGKKMTTRPAESTARPNDFKEIDLECLSPSSALDNFRKSRNLPNAQISAVNRIFKPSKEGELSGEANKRANLLLKEFETIVKRECINFFSSSKNKQEGQEGTKLLVDKAVETTLSLEMQNCSNASIISSASSIQSCRKTVLGLHSAAAKIQAAFKGYQLRKTMREANILPGSRKNTFITNDDDFFRSRSEDIRQRRRMSFYRTPEKPYDTKSKLKAVPLSAHPSHGSIDAQVQSYIPPPPMSAFSPRVSSHPQVLSPLGIPHARLNRSYDEPYPKEAIQKLHSAHTSPTRASGSLKADVMQSSNIHNAAENSGANEGHVNKNRITEISGMPGPSIADVIMEKLRLYAADKERNKPSKPDFIAAGASVAASSEVPYESDFESVSSITRHSERSHNVSITDDYFGPSESELRKRSSTPKQRSPSRRSKKHSRSKSPRIDSSVESTTTVDTDADLLPDSSKNKSSNTIKGSIPNESSKTGLTSSVSTPTVNLYNLPIPALKLRYQAEKERLSILDKALQATVTHENARTAGLIQKGEIFEMAKAAVDEQIKAKLTELEKDRPDTDSKQLTMMQMQCQAEATKSFCELSKWMTELHKSKEEMNQTVRAGPVDLAVIVYAAVDEAKRISEEQRKNRRRNRQHLEESTTRNRVCTDGTGHPPQQNQVVQRKDQQLQYPSCSERESSISSYRDSFDTGSELETTDDKTLESEVPVEPVRISEVIKSRAKNQTEIRTVSEKTSNVEEEQKIKSVAVSIPIAEKVIEIDDRNSNVEEPSSLHVIDDGIQQDSETEVPDELSMIAQSPDSFSTHIDVSEIPEQISEGSKIVDNKGRSEYSASVEVLDDFSQSITTGNTSEAVNQTEIPELLEESLAVKDAVPHDSDTEIPEELSVLAEGHDSHSKPIDVSTTQKVEVTKPGTDEESGTSTITISNNVLTQPQSVRNSEASSKCIADEGQPRDVSEQIFDAPIEPQIKNNVPCVSGKSIEIDIDNQKNSIHDPLSIAEVTHNTATETEIPDELLSMPVESFDSTNKPFDVSVNNIDEVNKTEITEETSDSSKVPEKCTSESVHYSEDFIDDLSESMATDDISESEINEKNAVEVSEKVFDKLKETGAEIADSLSEKVAEVNDSNKVDVQEPDEVPDDTDTEIPEELSILADESLDLQNETSDMLTEQKDEVNKPEVVAEESEINIILDKALALAESAHNSEDFEDEFSESAAAESPVRGTNSVRDNIVIDQEEQESMASQDPKADHIVVEIEDNEALQVEAAKILEERRRVENEIRELEALQNPIADYLNALELREKPPPPYSPPSSESLSYSSRSYKIAVQDDKVRESVVSRVNQIWDSWSIHGTFPALEKIAETEVETEQLDDEDNNIDRVQYVAQWANSSFDLLLSKLIDDTIRLVLHINDSPTAFVDQVRRGPMAVKARNIRIPKSKERLISTVYDLAVQSIPSMFQPEDLKSKDLTIRKVLLKWTCRPRDLVDEILLEEMVDEEHLWTELWPEELLVTEELTEKIIRDSIREVIRNCEIALNG